jgi:hypothetical protein
MPTVPPPVPPPPTEPPPLALVVVVVVDDVVIVDVVVAPPVLVASPPLPDVTPVDVVSENVESSTQPDAATPTINAKDEARSIGPS